VISAPIAATPADAPIWRRKVTADVVVPRSAEEEVHQGVRIPLGRGFAGRIAKER
jgi:hypothetical protein